MVYKWIAKLRDAEIAQDPFQITNLEDLDKDFKSL